MLKAAVFDDEYIVLRGVEEMIDWTSLGIRLVGTAGDGLAALELFRAHQPDIILTDIRMPGMDGLELIEQVMREAPDTFCIVFSGFNEFEYVKRAIQLGVADYMEKPITIPSIEKAVGKVLERYHKQKAAQEFQQKWEASRSELLEKATLDLLLNGLEESTAWRDTFGPEWEQVTGITVLAMESDSCAFPKDAAYRAVNVGHGAERIMALFHFGPLRQELWEEADEAAEQAGTAVGRGKLYMRLSEAPFSYKEAQRALRSARFLGLTGIVRFEDLGERITSPEGITDREEAIILSLRSGNRAGLMEQVESFLSWLKSGKPDAELAEHEMLKLIYLGLEEAKKSGGDRTAGLMDSYKPHTELRELAGKEDVAAWFRAQFERLADWSIAAREQTKHSAVEAARIYLEKYCSRDLTLQEVAEHVGMNPTYFSMLFKEEMGESYIKYLTRYRMELAKSLLSRGLRVQEVSEKVGYHTYRHFSEVFKKYAGVTPGQYSSGMTPT
ncbi:response regulator [Paenibacillus sp. P26]|nr:response regulator [Paenibacillus sp. P26]